MADIGSSFRDFRGVDGIVNDADPVASAKKIIASRSVRRSNGVTVVQALRSERKAEEGEGTRAFGAPLTSPADNQSTDSNN